MKVQRFRAQSSVEALAKVKETLGEEAVILSTRRVKEGSKWLYEITAAVDFDPPVEPRPREIENFSTLLKELETIKILLERLNGSLKPKTSFFYHLLSQEIPQAALLLFGSNGDLTPENFLKTLSKKVAQKVRFVELPQIQFFVGQGGVGKTSSAVKLAARLLYQGYRVAILSLDTVRVGAREQIDRFAALLEIPLQLVRHDQDFAQKIRDWSDYDYLLVDTPALGAFFSVSRLSRLLQEVPEAGVHLVVPATEAPSGVLALLEKFRGQDLFSIILTHSESLALGGPLFWTLLPQVPPISFISTGERVPEDFERATSRRLLGLLLRNLELEEASCTSN